MKRLYTPQKKKAIEILKAAGFVNANRGFVLLRKKPRDNRPVQIHALIEFDGDIDLHEDYDKDGVHFSKKRSGRLDRFIDILNEIDLSLPSSMGDKLFSHYTWKEDVRTKYTKVV